jgi:hypothetical protein
LMIPVYRWDVSVVPFEGLKLLKSGFHLKSLKIIEYVVLHLDTTVHMNSGRPADF